MIFTMMKKTFLDNLEYKVTGACIEVHKMLGPGLLESVYQKCLIRELQLQQINFTAEHSILISYKDILLDTELRADLVIENCIVVELKSVENILPIHEAQILTYMKLLKVPKGLLINFNSTNIVQHGKRAFVSEYMYKFDV
ncbi:GxxExxY protein [Pedobacter chinensis]|uniref:GxxExxY protein n=2 Tax=Pedobacter chinensis TaxID=2282421 RepID=A0A369Q1U8_9SPHI|nr:GxxExxY protein [Pedobacter chinensis]